MLIRNGLALACALMVATLSLDTAADKSGLGVTVVGVKGRVSASTPLTMTAKLRWRGPAATFTYAWKSLGRSALPYDTERDQAKLTIAAGELTPGTSYDIELTVTAKYIDHSSDPPAEITTSATSKIAFEVNAPPTGGRCVLEPRWHGPAAAALTLSAPDWSDDHSRVQYRYHLIRNGKSHLIKNWSHNKRYEAQSIARPGDTFQARCEVRDRLGDTNEAVSKEIKRQ